jgi:hypothetical protein
LSPETMIRACFTRKSSSPDSVQSLSPKSSLHLLLLFFLLTHFFFLFSFFLLLHDNTHIAKNIITKFLLIIGTLHIQKKSTIRSF